MPILLLAAILLPAVIIALVAGLTHASSLPLAYTSYVIDLSAPISVFVAAQSPATVSRDLRFKVMPLYFSRPLSRSDYVLAKFAAMVTALFVLMALPLVALYLGALLGKLPFWAQTRGVLTGLAGAVLFALVLAGIGLVIASLTPRRGFGIAAIIVVLLVLGLVGGILQGLTLDAGHHSAAGYFGLVSPFVLVDGVQVWLFGADPTRRPDRPGTLGGVVFLAVSLAVVGRVLRGPAAPVPEGGRVVTTSLVLDKVSRWYGNVVAVNDVTMEIGPGVTGLLGPNGAGKSTLIHLMSGFLAPSSGTVTLGGEPTWHNEQIYRRIGIVPEREAMYDGVTGWDFVLANAQLQRLPDPAAAARSAIATVEMIEAQDRDISTYSKGMKQRIKMATALVHDPEVLLLDEPFNGMDPRQRLQLMDLLRRSATRAAWCCSARTSWRRSSRSPPASR